MFENESHWDESEKYFSWSSVSAYANKVSVNIHKMENLKTIKMQAEQLNKKINITDNNDRCEWKIIFNS